MKQWIVMNLVFKREDIVNGHELVIDGTGTLMFLRQFPDRREPAIHQAYAAGAWGMVVENPEGPNVVQRENS